MLNNRFRLWVGVFAAVAGAAGLSTPRVEGCDYALLSTKIQQCRPIKLLDGPEQKPAWTYINDSTGEAGVLAHIVCVCKTTLETPDPACKAGFEQKVSFTQPTSDILKSCAQPALCQDACQAFIDHS